MYLPLITTNCAVLGVALLNTQNSYNFVASVIYGITGGLGFLLAMVLFSGVRRRVDEAEPPKASRHAHHVDLRRPGVLELHVLRGRGRQPVRRAVGRGDEWTLSFGPLCSWPPSAS